MSLKPKIERVLVFPDAHHPYHDQRAWKCMLEAGKLYEPHRIICLGDFIDCHSISNFTPDPDRESLLKYELSAANTALDEVDALFPAAKKHFIAGNHEARLAKYIAERAPELFGLIDIPGLLKLKERKWGYTPYPRHMRIGKLVFTHGTSTVKNHPRANLAAYQASVCYGHCHTIQEATGGDALGNIKVAFTPGHLSDVKKATYLKAINDWCHGFATVYIQPNGRFFHNIHKIVKGRTIFHGQLIQG